ncbi:MAG: DUF1835 domain-containing protein [Victivallis vadensis]
MELHIFNGDCAFEAWRSSGGTAAALVWRENYLEGRIPGKAVPPEEFERIRAEELHRLIPELDREKILAELRKMDQAVAGLSGRDSVFLWFDACMYDQIMLSRILFLLENTPARVFLVCEDVVWGEHPELFVEKKPEARLLSGADLRLFASAWEAVAEGEETLRRFPAGEGAGRFPFLAKALARYREEFPGADGLGRSERQLLEIIRSGKHSGPEIFRAAGACEEHPFMGDTMCRRLLEGLAARRLIEIRPGGDSVRYLPAGR